MSMCTLKIVLDHPHRTYASGEKARGVVEADVHSDCECRKLSLHREWRTHGKGNAYSGGKQEWELFSGTWTAGQNASYPFEFEVPRGPLTYRGHILSITWHLRAHADLAHALDQKVEEEFVLAAGQAHDEGSPGRPGRASDQISITAAEAKKKGPVVYAIAIPAFFITLGVSLWFASGLLQKTVLHHWLQAHFPHDAFARVFLAGFGALFFGIIAVTCAGFILSTLGYELAMRKLGQVKVELSSKTVRPGGSINCKIHFRPRSQVELKKAVAQLRGVEWAHWTSGGTSMKTRNYTHTLFDRATTIASRQTLVPGQDIVLEGTIQVPPDAPYTIQITDNELNWSLEVILSLHHWPGWSDVLDIAVRP